MGLVVISDHNRICDCLSDHFMHVIFEREYDPGERQHGTANGEKELHTETPTSHFGVCSSKQSA